MAFPEFRTTETVTIAGGAALSSVLNLDGGQVAVGIVMPGTWTAADLTFQMSADGTTYVEVYSGGAAYSETAAASIYIPLDVPTMWGCKYVKVRSGTSGTPVNQAALRTLTIVVRSSF